MIRASAILKQAAGIGLFVIFTQTAMAQEPKLVGEFSDWSAYAYDTNSGKVCYVVSQPKKSEPTGVNRDPVFFLVTHRPGDNVRSEVNTIIGYPFRKNSSATVTVDGAGYRLFTSGDGAWADSAATDKKVVAAMKKGRSMKVSGTSWRGTKTSDEYSLSGVTAAMDKIDALCN